jgi:hypothetical protein
LKEQPWESHYQQILFRVLDSEQAEQDEFENWRQKILRHCAPRIKQQTTSKQDMYDREYGQGLELYGPAPFCIQTTLPEMNLDLAKLQLEEGANPTPEFMYRLFRPQGVCVTPEETMLRTQSGAAGQMRVLTVQGPAQVRNTFGAFVEEGDQVWIQMRAVPVPSNPRYRINMDGQFIGVTNKVGRKMMWQLHYYHGKKPPTRDVMNTQMEKNTGGDWEETTCADQYGYNFRIGTVQHVYQANMAPMSFLGVSADNQMVGTFNNDIHAAHLAPAIRIFVDMSSNGFY